MKLQHLAALTAILLALGAGSRAHAQTVCTSDPDGLDEVPPTTSDGDGLGVFILSADGTTLQVIASAFHDPSETITGSHLHNAPAGVNGPVVFDIGADYSVRPIILTWAIPADMVSELLAGNLYYNVHTNTFPAGAMRGQVVCR